MLTIKDLKFLEKFYRSENVRCPVFMGRKIHPDWCGKLGCTGIRPLRD